MRQWLLPNLGIDLKVGGSFRSLGADGETWINGTVLEIVLEGRLVLSWMEEDMGWAHPGRLVIELAPIASGTKVTLVHDGFAGIGKPDWQDTANAYERGADHHRVLEQLSVLVMAGV